MLTQYTDTVRSYCLSARRKMPTPRWMLYAMSFWVNWPVLSLTAVSWPMIQSSVAVRSFDCMRLSSVLQWSSKLELLIDHFQISFVHLFRCFWRKKFCRHMLCTILYDTIPVRHGYWTCYRKLIGSWLGLPYIKIKTDEVKTKTRIIMSKRSLKNNQRVCEESPLGGVSSLCVWVWLKMNNINSILTIL